jgi:tetratricopeptide (TPR) repeat protein
MAYRYLAYAHAQQGRLEEALKEIEEVARASGDANEATVAYVYAMAGEKSRALSFLIQAPGLKKRQETPSSLVARTYVSLGERERALDWLEAAYRERDPYMVFLKVDPRWDPLRSAARFQDLLRRMDFPP